MIFNAMNSVLLQTAIACMFSAEIFGESPNIRMNSEICSQRSYVTKSSQKLLNLPVSGTNTLIIKIFVSQMPKIEQSAIQTRGKSVGKLM